MSGPPCRRARGCGLPCVLLALGLVTTAGFGCRPRVVCPRRAVEGKPAASPRVERRSLALVVSPDETVPPVGELPPFPTFTDPHPLPPRSLKRERNLAWKAEGAERQLVITHLAARLWRLANANLDQIRLLEEATRSSGTTRPEAKLTALRREASAHLQECVSLLEGVLETPNPPRLARVRLAYYLRELNPRAALPLFRKLLADEPPGPRRDELTLDLAQLLLRDGARLEAAALFPRGARLPATPRGRLLRALALAGHSGVLDEASLRGVLSDCGRDSSPLASVIALQLPALLAAVSRPAHAFERLRSAPPACLRYPLDRLAVELTERLLARGRLGSARVLVGTLRQLGVPQDLLDRVAEETGPFPASSLPPGNVRLGRLLASRLRAVALCVAPHAPVEMGLVLRLQGDGRARLLPTSPLASAASPSASPSAPSPGSPLHCIGEAVPRWRLPTWRVQVVLELSVLVSIRPVGQRRSPRTGPD